mmetsp:Transcript_5933/g.25817  ORF Transcript_5933/g.25817 Transcript_5933/m.25817 type:complete len:201 (+) Transcript_5933:2618-3220(+)
MSRRPAAQSNFPRTSSQSPLSWASVSDDARCTAFSMRVSAVPGYSARVPSVSPLAPSPPIVALVRTGENETGALPTGSHDDGSGAAPVDVKGDVDEGSTAARAGEMETRKDAAVSRSARRPRTDSAARCRWWELPCPECAMMSREPRPRKGGSGARFARSARRESGRADAFTRTDVRTSAVCILRGCRRAGTCDGWIPER